MRILDRYILKSVLSLFFAAIIGFCFLFILIDSAMNLDEFLDSGVSMGTLLQYYLAYLPFIMVQTSSVAGLIAALFTYSNLNNTNEVIVLRSSGLSFWQMTKPVIIFSLVMAAFVFFINERFVPETDSNARRIKNESIKLESADKNDKKRKKRPLIKNLTFYGLKNRLYYIDSFDPNTYELKHINIISYDNNQNVKEKITALHGTWTGIAWKFFQCNITNYAESINDPIKVRIYEDKLVDIKETPEDFMRQRLNVTAMNMKELKDYIERFTNSGAKRALNNLKVDLCQKLAFPLRNVVILLVGLPLVLIVRSRKSHTFTSIGIAMAIGFLYYVSEAVGLALGKGEALPPLLAAFLAPILFTGVAIYLIKTNF